MASLIIRHHVPSLPIALHSLLAPLATVPGRSKRQMTKKDEYSVHYAFPEDILVG